MAKVTKKVLGASRGKVADVVFRKFRTATVAQGYQPKPLNPKSESQQIQRTKFKALSSLAREMVSIIMVGMKASTKGTMRTPRNLFIMLNKTNVTSTTPGVSTFEMADVVVSDGRPDGLDYGALAFDTPNVVDVTWESNNPDTPTDASVYIGVYAPDVEQAIISTPVAVSAEAASVPVPSSWNGLKVWVYGFVVNETTNHPETGWSIGVTSKSQCLGYGNVG